MTGKELGSGLNAGGQVDDHLSMEDIKQHCSKVLHEVGASEDYTNFFVDVLQCEHDIDESVHKHHQALHNGNKQNSLSENTLVTTIQDLTKNYNDWKVKIDSLVARGRDLPPLKIESSRISKSRVFTALCSIQTKEMKVSVGDELTITDTSQPNRLKVRNKHGDEGYIPTLSCLLPSPDRSALYATDRLRLHLLASWRDSISKCKANLMMCLVATSRKLVADWKTYVTSGSSVSKERISRRLRRLTDIVDKQAPSWDLTKLHNSLFSLEKELNSWNVNGTEVDDIDTDEYNEITKHVGPVIDTVAALDKAVLCYQMFRKQWHLYRKSFERTQRPMRIVDQVDQLQPLKGQRNYRYYEVKVTREETETVEEIVETIPPPGGSGGGGSRKETVSAEQLTTDRAEERRRFIITGVIDPRTRREISFQDAISQGIIDQNRGMYVDPTTGAGCSIPEAMNNGSIKVSHTSATVTKEETKAVGLITIRTQVDNRHYTITAVTDAVSGANMTLDEARKKGIIDDVNGVYITPSTGEKVALDNAIQSGWVQVEYDEASGEPEYESKTYAVNAVVDQKLKKKVPFYEAVSRGLIDRDTGNYVNNVTGEKIYVAEAIRRGFLKAHEVEDTAGLDIDTENKVVVERMEKIRRNVLKSVGVINAFKMGAGGLKKMMMKKKKATTE